MPYKEVAMKRLGPPHVALLWPAPRLRLTGAVLILGAALGGAAILHGLPGSTCPIECPARLVSPPNPRLPWADPAALAFLVIGTGGAAGFLLIRRAWLRVAFLVLLADVADWIWQMGNVK
jgi:hypothetical protein